MNVQYTQPLSRFGFPTEQELTDNQEKVTSDIADIVTRIMTIFGDTIKMHPKYSEYQFKFPYQLRENICKGIEKEFKGQNVYKCTIRLRTEQYVQQTCVSIYPIHPSFEMQKLITPDHDTFCINHCKHDETCPSMIKIYNSKYYD